MIKKVFLSGFMGFIILGQVSPQVHPDWDNPLPQIWPEKCETVKITSSFDGKIQPAIFLKSEGNENRPLIVRLHTWSAGYDQRDTLVWKCVEKNYNYIHPHFRGTNDNPEACGSMEAIRDIDDAISYALQNAKVDTSSIHILGASGGGYATLLAYMNSRYPVKTFSAWVPISDIYKWFYESVGRGKKYARDIANATNHGEIFKDGDLRVNKEEALLRSPFYMETPIEQRKNAKLSIHAGIHDGYTGSVPITQSLLFYNKLVNDFDSTAEEAMIPEENIIELVSSRYFNSPNKDTLGGRVIHYQKTYLDKVRIVIFEGRHEMLPDVALEPMEGKKILAIGDSNGASPGGWVDQMKRLNFNHFIFNASISGNTIGFDNNGRQDLNTLRNLDKYLVEAFETLGEIDNIIIMLGTNECKAVFADSLILVPRHLQKLLRRIQKHPLLMGNKPAIYIVSPPPIGKDETMAEKYHGGAARVNWLQAEFKKVAAKEGITYIDIHSDLMPDWENYTKDGIHLTEDGQKIIAGMIMKTIGAGRE